MALCNVFNERFHHLSTLYRSYTFDLTPISICAPEDMLWIENVKKKKIMLKQLSSLMGLDISKEEEEYDDDMKVG